MTREVSKTYKDTDFDVIFSSPLMRTMQTANIMNEYHNVKIIKDDRLLEINQGIFTGRLKSSFTDEEKRLRYKRDSSCGMEKYESVGKRVKDFVDDLKKNNKYNSVLIVTHCVTATFMEFILQDKEIDYRNRDSFRRFENSEIKCFEI